MINSVYSRVDQSVLLHQYFHPYPDASNQFTRQNISPENESLQVAYLTLPKGKTFKAHKHIVYDRNMPMSQESWIVLDGEVKVFYYDLDDSLHSTVILTKGAISVTYRGGHNYLSLTDPAVVYEYKTGPYMGIEYDKVFLK